MISLRIIRIRRSINWLYLMLYIKKEKNLKLIFYLFFNIFLLKVPSGKTLHVDKICCLYYILIFYVITFSNTYIKNSIQMLITVPIQKPIVPNLSFKWIKVYIFFYHSKTNLKFFYKNWLSWISYLKFFCWFYWTRTELSRRNCSRVLHPPRIP